MWTEKQNLWRSCKKLTILVYELPVSLNAKQYVIKQLGRVQNADQLLGLFLFLSRSVILHLSAANHH